MKVKIKLLREGAVMPAYQSESAACADLHACIDAPATIGAGCTVKIPTGIAIEPERNDIAALVYIRSGLGAKKSITLANSVGVIDADYRGEIFVPLINHGSEAYIMEPGERFAQLMFVPVLHGEFEICDELGDTERGEGGFGSTGRQ